MSEGKKKPIMLIIIAILVIVLGVGAYFAYTILIKKPGGEAGKKTEVKYVEEKLVEKTLPLESFTVNLADEDKPRYVQTTITLAYPDKNKGLDEEINSKLIKIQDIITTTLRLKKSEDFDGNKLIDVKKELRDKINENLVEGRLTNIYTTKFVIQK